MNGPYARTIATDIWEVVYTYDFMQIGCQGYAIADWWEFNSARIASMDEQALEWWERWKPILKQIIDTAPCKPTGAKQLTQRLASQLAQNRSNPMVKETPRDDFTTNDLPGWTPEEVIALNKLPHDERLKARLDARYPDRMTRKENDKRD